MQRPTIEIAVVVERHKQPNRWQDWRFRIAEVLPNEAAFGSVARKLHDDGRVARWLHPAITVELFADEGKGYCLNLTSGNPSWFVLWRIDASDASRAEPAAVSLSYNEAARWLDNADEQMDSLPLPADVRDWLQAFTDVHYQPVIEPRRKPRSFLNPRDRANGR
jgi:hypothetical protein